MSSKRPSIREIARQAGLAPITVSRVFSEPAQVAPETRARVEAIAAQLGYVHGRPPAHMRGKENNLIGVILPGLQFSLFSDFVAGVQELAEKHKYDVLIGISNFDQETEEAIIRSMLARSTDGLVVVGEVGKPSRKLLSSQKKWLRIVEAWGAIKHPVDMVVAFDNCEVGSLAARHFIDRGYRHPAYAGSLTSRDGERLNGFRKTILSSLNQEPPVIDLTPEVETEQVYLGSGARVFNELAELHPQVDALFCSIDEIAHGVQFEALRRGIHIPSDLALCGCGDRPYAAAIEPPLTTVAVPGYEMGKLSAEVLLGGISNRSASDSADLQPKLIVRGTT